MGVGIGVIFSDRDYLVAIILFMERLLMLTRGIVLLIVLLWASGSMRL